MSTRDKRERIAARLHELAVRNQAPAQARGPEHKSINERVAARLRELSVRNGAPVATPAPTHVPETGVPSEATREPIAIIGLSGYLPGCGSVREFWQALDREVSLIEEIPRSRFDWRACYDPEGKDPNRMATRWGGFIPNIRGFDPTFFRTVPRQADYLDPRLRLLMMSVYQTLEDAGHAPSSLKGQKVGVFIGVEDDEYQEQIKADGLPQDIDPVPSSLIANYLSYLYDFRGPSEFINTLCSSGAVALHRAVSALRSGEADQAVVGAANLILRPDPFIQLSRSGQMSRSATVHSFGRDAAGFLRAEGVASVLLKPLSQAERDGDAIYAVIRNSAVNYNGQGGVSIASPNISTHAALIADCYRQAGIDPRDLDYIEAQGMGNPVADIAEWGACNQALRTLAEEQHVSLAPGSCRISTLKPFCGHMHAASALGALFKIIHALQSEHIPKILDFDQMSPDLDDPGQPCRIAQKREAWPDGSRPRLAGLHSYGAGGSNAHLLIEEYARRSSEVDSRSSEVDNKTVILPVSAATEAACRTKIELLLVAVEQTDAPLVAIAGTLQLGRDAMTCRVAFVTQDREAWLRQVRSYLSTVDGESLPDGVFAGRATDEGRDKHIAQQAPAILAREWTLGAAVTWPSLKQHTRLHLPTHPFNLVDCWYDEPSSETTPQSESANQPVGEDLRKRAEHILRHLLAPQLKIEAGELNLDMPFEQWGFDSILVLRLAETLHRDHGFAVEAAHFFEFTTPRSLAAYLAEQLAEQAQPAGAERPCVQRRPTRPVPRTVADEPIAIIGLAGTYPHAPNLETFWQNLLEGRDCIDEIPAERWSLDFFDPDPKAAAQNGRSYGKWGGFIENLYHFDPLFFGISPREAVIMNPKEPLVMQCAWHVLEDAGYSPDGLSDKTVGVFIGVTRAGTDPYPGTFASMTNRISYAFDFQGPSFPIDTMCSSSLVAIHEACRHLRDGECSVALAGGVNAYVDPSHYAVLAAGQFLSPDGRCRSFGADANGMVPGEGVGVLLLKPLSRAEQDGDHIYAVIRGSATNHGGRTNGFTVPNPKAHRDLIRLALDRAGVDARQVSYVEAHGTGTTLGDPIEIRGLAQAFAYDTEDTGFCSIGSVKSNIGHLEAAAGISGITKILLQMKHGSLVPSLHSDSLNRQIDFPSTPFFVQQDVEPWNPTDENGDPKARIACVSSFGAGGSNAHVVLEAYTKLTHRLPAIGEKPHAIVLSARDETRLGEQAAQLLSFLGREVAAPVQSSDCEPRQPLTARLCQMLADIIGVDADDIDIDEPFSDYGVEPLHQEVLLEKTGDAFQTPALKNVLSYATVAELADALIRSNMPLFHVNCFCLQEDEPRLEDIAFTLQVGREAMSERFACVVTSKAGLTDCLRGLIDHPDGPFDGKTTFRGRTQAHGGQPAGAPREADGLAAVLESWVAGHWVDWHRLNREHEARRISLPGYPFAREYHRMDDTIVATTSDAAAATPAPMVVHPSQIASRETHMLAYRPVWKDAPIPSQRVTDDISRQVFLCGLPEGGPEPEVSYRHLHSDQLTPDARYTDLAIQLFEQIRALFEARERGRVLVQVLVPGETEDGYSGLAALLKTAHQENPRCLFQLIELDEQALQEIPRILREDRHPEETHIRYCNQRRERLHWQEIPTFSQAPQKDESPWKNKGTYLITGGLGALGLIFAREIAATTTGATLILTGRSRLTATRREQLAKLERLGAQVRYERVDVGQRDQVEALITELRNEVSGAAKSLNGILHCAGLIRDSFILKKTGEEFRSVLAPKVAGTAHLDQVTRDMALDFFALFSSGAGAFGNTGQADYAAANGFMDACAARDGHRFTAINWPLWQEGGMKMDTEAERILRRHTGATPLQTGNGIAALVRALSTHETRLMVVEGDPDVIRHNLSGRTAVDVDKMPVSAPVAPDVDNLGEQTLDRLCQLLGSTIGLDAEDIDAQEPLESYGIDSVLIMQLTDALEAVFGALSKTLFYQYLNLADLADFLVEAYPDGCQKWCKALSTAADGAEQGPEGCGDESEVEPIQISEPASRVAHPAEADPWRNAVAIIGISARHPLADDLESFWQNLLDGRECIREIPEERWDWREAERNGNASRWGAFLEDCFTFDPMFFKIPPREADNIDPQERLFLEASWKAMEDAGYAPSQLPDGLRRRTGVFAGITKQGFNLYSQTVDNVFPMTSFSSMVNRVSYQLNLQGPSIPFDTMCASSLVALHEACDYLRRGDGDMALAGGVNLYLHAATYTALTLGQILSSGSHCAAFGTEGDGFVPGEAVGAVVLKRYQDAVADGDDIYAVIRGSAVNHGGKTNGYTVPNPNQQAAAIRQALDMGGIDAETVSYIEAAANGSPMGDAIEMTALTEVFGSAGPRAGYHIGSIKPNIGHGESASGISQLTRVLLAMRHKTLPPTVLHGELNGNIQFDQLPFALVREATPWTAPILAGKTAPRRAGITNVSSGGVNAHLILEEYLPPKPVDRPHGQVLFVLSARNEERLEAYMAQWLDYLKRHPLADLAAIAYTLQVGRDAMPCRLAIVANDVETLKHGLSDKAACVHSTVAKVKGDRREAVRQASAAGDLEQLAELWVAGHTIPWPELHCNMSRINGLPTYPFARKRCWILPPNQIKPFQEQEELMSDQEYENKAAEYYTHATRGADENFQEEYLTFAPFEEKIPGFSSSRVWLDPVKNAADHELMKSKQVEMRQVLFCSEDFQRIESLIDIGCGHGTDVIQVAGLYPHITTHGFTITKAQAELGNHRIASRNLAPRARIFHKNSAVAPFPGRYDVAIGIEVTFHIRDKDALFGNIVAGLKDNGRILLMDYIANLRGQIVDHDVEVSILTRQNWLDLLARHRLRITELIDVSPQVANFLYDPECEENIKGLPKVTQDLWLNHANQAIALEKGWITYCLMKFQKEPQLDEAALRQHNLEKVTHQTPYPEALRAMLQSGHIPYPQPQRLQTPAPEPGASVPEPAAIDPAPAQTPASTPDRSRIRARLITIFSRVLGFEKREIEENDNFEDLGISSINAVELLEAINTAFDLYLPTSIVFECNDLDSLSEHVQASLPTIPSPEVLALEVPVPEAPLRQAPVGSEPAPPRAGISIPATVPAQRAPVAEPVARPQVRERDDIAAIGIACRCAGANDKEAFWKLVSEGLDGLERVGDRRVLDDFSSHSENEAVLRYGIMSEPDLFDPLFFHISPKEAEMMDYTQRILLEESYKAWEDAGCAPSSLKKQSVGTYIGVTGEQHPVSQASHLAILGADPSILAARIAFFLDLKGPALAINTACSSSLVAMDLAYRALQQGDIDLAIVGGITISGSIDTYASMNNAGMISPSGTCRPFDNAADGIVVGDGVGVVILKRLRDAQRDHHTIYGVIRGSGTNQDGRTSGITVPSYLAQSELECAVYRGAGINAADIQYVEAHGTATKLGDPVEVHALTHSFAQFTPQKRFCAIGSLKANIGHTAAAAGVLSAIKVLLSLKHGQIPPSINFTSENEHIDFQNSPVYVNTELVDWPHNEHGYRLAAVSSFGYSGTNAHMLLSDVAQTAESVAPFGDNHLFVLSATSEDQLREQARNLLAWLQAHPDCNLTDVAYSLQVGRDAMAERLGLIVSSQADLCAKLTAYLAGDEDDDALYRDRVQRNDTLALFDTDEALQEATEKWLWSGRLGSLLALWVKGLAFDWNRLYTGTRPRLISLPTYPFKRDHYPLGGTVETQSAPRATSVPLSDAPTALQAVWDGFSFLPQWQEAPLAIATAAGSGTYRSILVVSSGDADHLVTALGNRCRREQPDAALFRIRLGEQTRQISEHEWSCGADPNGLATCLEASPVFDAVFFISCDEGMENLGASECQLLRLIQRLRHQMTDLYLLTADNFRVGLGSPVAGGGGLTGLACSIAQGDHRLRVRNLDLAREDLRDPDQCRILADHIMDEPASERGEVFCLPHGRRYQRHFLKLNVASLPTTGLRQNGVYVIVGGSGTVGRIVTEHLMRVYQAKVIWIGRRPRQELDLNESPQPSLYVQADLTRPETMQAALQRIKQAYATIHGAIFAGLVFHLENAVDKTSEREFKEIIDVKIAGSLNFYQTFVPEPLDFMCWFSSVQAFSFLSSGDSAGYATGITLADTLVAALQDKAPFPIGMINWGYWQASVAGTVLEQRLKNHFETIADEDGCRFFERFAAALRAGLFHQALYLGASPAVRQLMNCPETETVSLAPVGAPALLHDLRQYHNERPFAQLLKNDPWPELNTWMARLLFVQMRRLEIFSDDGLEDSETLRKRAGVIDKYARWWHECCLSILEDSGYLACNGTLVALSDSGRRMEDGETVWKTWETYQQRYRDNPDLKTSVNLVDACLRGLPEILRGTLQATEVIFPRSSMENVENIYKRNVLSDYFNAMVAEVVARYIRGRLAEDANARIRIIEIGAGTGGTTAIVLPALMPLQEHIDEYCYTDLSKAFLMHAEQHYGPDCPFLSQDLWNVEQSPASQGIKGTFDIAIATNVLHATRDIRQTLRNAKAALKHNGILVLNENIAKTMLGTLTFGLLDGWWLYEDESLRIPGCPLLTPQSWQQVLAEEGWTTALLQEDAARTLGQQIIVAQGNGIIRQQPEQARPESIIRPVQQSVTTHESEGEFKGNIGNIVKAAIRQSLSQSLNLPTGDIDGRIPFSDYGIDSILGVSFINQANESLDISMNTTILFDQTTVDDLTDFILNAHGEEIAGRLAKEGGQKEEPTLTPVPSEPVRQTRQPRATQRPVRRPAATGTDRPVRGTSIAVIGLSGQFPGAKDPAAFWQNLVEGIDGIRELSAEYGSGPDSCRWGGMLEDRHCFDPLFFHIAPREAEVMNVHQRLVLQESWKSLEDAGYNPRSLTNTKAGIYIGAEPSGQINASLTGSSDAIIASRLSYHLNLKGPAMVVNTGCSSSGVAIHLACESLRSHETEMALAGGVFATMVANGLNTLADVEMLSPTGACHTFDKTANGTVLSEGVGIVVLKRLEDAIAAGDPIYGVIEGSGVNQDGASNGITAPNGAAQEALMTDVYRRFDIDPGEISYFEAHGTGTRLGDPVEANAMVRAFTRFTDRKASCAIGSAKSYIGHTSAAAGVIGLIQILLSLKYRQLPKLLHFHELNPLIEFDDSPFYVNTELREWASADGKPRMAALNSFGHSGTNAHLVVREYIAAPSAPAAPGPYLIALSARDEQRLREYAGRLLDFVRGETPHPADLAYTLQVGRDAMEERLGLQVASLAELEDKLVAFLETKPGSPPGDGFCRGQVRPNRETIDLLAEDEDTHHTIDAWMQKRKYTPLLALWVRGLPLDWDWLYDDAARPRRIHLPTYPFARNHYGVDGEETQPGDQPAVALSAPVKPATSMPAVADEIPPESFGYLPRWEEAETLFDGEAAALSHRDILLVHGSESFHFETTIRAFYQERYPQARVRQIRLADHTRHIAEDEWLCDVADPEGLVTCLQDAPVPDALYFIASFQERSEMMETETLNQSLETNEIQLLRLIKLLRERMQPGDGLDCYLLTVDNHAVMEASNPYGAGVSGLAYAIAQGDHRIRVRNLDLAREEMENTVEQEELPAAILAEPPSDRGEAIRLQYGTRQRRHFFRLDWNRIEGSGLKQGGVYVILGGSGVVGQIMTRYLIREYAAHVVWIGRQPESAPVLHERLAPFREAGSEPFYIQADVTDADAMMAAVRRIRERYETINGAIFSGLVFDHENSVAQTSEADYRAILDVKTRGSLNFYNAFRSEPLDFMCWFSSIQTFSFLSARDSCGYATGISFADTFVRSIEDAPFPLGIVNWGYWAASVLGSPLEERLKNHFAFIEDECGFRYFEKYTAVLRQGVRQMLCLGPRATMRELMHCNDKEIISIYESSVLLELELP
uniref:CalF n=1 Tax=uncultured Candidatus Entotheonella sp. TaxID=312019 RepID=A0A068PCT2_9BACT|nr:CalF [uncultured Candidatus Entotheonella sp.]